MVFQNHFRSQAILLDQLFYNSRNLILITLPEFSEERPVVLIGFTGQLGPAYSADGNQGVWRKWTNHNVWVGRGDKCRRKYLLLDKQYSPLKASPPYGTARGTNAQFTPLKCRGSGYG